MEKNGIIMKRGKINNENGQLVAKMSTKQK